MLIHQTPMIQRSYSCHIGGWLGWPTRDVLKGSERDPSHDQGGKPETDTKQICQPRMAGFWNLGAWAAWSAFYRGKNARTRTTSSVAVLAWGIRRGCYPVVLGC